MGNEKQRSELIGLSLIAGGALLVSFSLGGYVIGYWVDRALGTAPVWSVLGLLIGFLIGIYDFYRIAMRIMNQQPLPSATPQDESTQGVDDHAPDKDEFS